MSQGQTVKPVFVHVRQTVLESLKEKLSKGEPINAAEIRQLTAVEDAPATDMLIPIDLSERLERAAVLALNPKADAESYIKAEELFRANPSGLSDEERPEAMTALEYQTQEMVGCEGDDAEEVSLVDEDPEDDDWDEDDEEEQEDEDEVEEPVAKRSKTASSSSQP
mmetsp:Transcript_9173/g.20436  ORF Transcript_9173/g.20436 Transcript_9173/m.20436 type:complete len:166 (-) Transcript_9173:102-599(-)